MSEIQRKLATIESILELTPHPNADRLEIAKVRGWNVIVQKDLYKVNDLVVYFEIDSFIPVSEPFEFLRKSSFRSTKNLGDGFRVKTMKLRGVVSQGLCMPLNEVQTLIDAELWGPDFLMEREEGFDVTEPLGVQKYEKPIPSNLAGKVRGNFPSFIPKTDQERLQNLGKFKYGHENDVFEVTEKMDGSSMTVYLHEGVFGVCSRNMDLLEDETNTFWQVARKLNLEEKMRDNLFPSAALQGEVVGPGIQGNPYDLKEHEFHIFDIWDIENRIYVLGDTRRELVNNLGLKHVEVIGINIDNEGPRPWNGIPTPEQAQEICKLFDVKEGLVCKSLSDPSFSFKYINENYLLNERD